MARASFEELMKKRTESKAAQVTEQRERGSERISFDSAVAKRKEAIKKKKYEGSEPAGEQVLTMPNSMYVNPQITKNRKMSESQWTKMQLGSYEEARDYALSNDKAYKKKEFKTREKQAYDSPIVLENGENAGGKQVGYGLIMLENAKKTWEKARKEYYEEKESEDARIKEYYTIAEKEVEAEHEKSRKEWEATNPMATDQMKRTFENIYRKDKDKFVKRRVEEYINPWKKLTNDKYADYLKNIEEKANSEKQKEWLEKQKNNLEILRDDDEISSLFAKCRKRSNAPNIILKMFEEMRKKGYSNDVIDSLYDTYTREKNAHTYQKMEKDVERTTGTVAKNVGHSIISIGANLGSAMGAGDTLYAGVKSLVTGEYVPIDTHSYGHYMGGYRDAVRQNVTEDIQDADEKGNVKWYNRLAGDVYNAGMPVADNLTATAIGGEGVALGLMGLSAGAGASKDAFERTGSTGKAIATGAISGAIEAVTNKLSLDNLYDIYKQSGKAATRNMVVNLLAQSGIEGSEEAISEVANHFVDRAINQDKSEYELNVNQYMNSGMSEEDARKNASKDVFKQVLEAGKIGALAGGIGAGVATAGQQVNKVNTGMEIRGSEMTEDVLVKAEGYEDSKVQKALKKYQEKPSDYAMGKLVYEMQTADAIEQYNSEKQKKRENRENTKISEEIEVEPQTVQNNGQEETISGNDMQMKTGETPVSIPDRVSSEKSTIVDTQIETPKHTESKQKVQEAREKMNVAKTAVDLVQARKVIEENGTSEEIEDAKDFFEYRKARLMHSQGVDVQEFAQAESVKTESEAYELGKRNIEIPDAQLTVSSRIAYNEGKYEAALKLNQARTITARSVISNASVQTADGKNMVVSKILDVEGEPRLQTKEGTVQLQSVTFLNPTVQKVYNVAATKSNTQLAQTFLDCYPDNIGVYNYNLLFNKFAKAGELGRDFNKVLAGNQTAQIYLSKESLKKIYDAGAKKNVVAESKTETKRDTVKRKGSGQVVDKRNSKAKEELQKVYEKAAEKMGIDIVLKDTDVDDINGSFNQALSEMVLNMKSNTYEALLHEIGEFTDLWNGEDMYTFQTAFMEWYFDEYGDKAAEQIEAYQRAYEKAEGSKSLREASDEMMRDGLAGLFGTEEGVQDFAKWLQDNRSAKESKTILESVAEFFKNLCNKIQSYISNHTLSPTAEAALRLQENKASELRKMFLEATDKAIENYQKAGVDDTINAEIRLSLVGKENGIEVYETSDWSCVKI